MFAALIKFHYLLYSYVLVALLGPIAIAIRDPDGLDQKRQVSAPSPLVNFQVSLPILTPSGQSNQYGCVYTETLMEHEFANSYGSPFVGKRSLTTGP